ncbi:hypothetical protein BGZ60DRAFT_436095 [Tricladium varicosporioides]|nr:hypothetical protein BGZ60DRAFT_436095 [Hymenoscyphus varicosporioides]
MTPFKPAYNASLSFSDTTIRTHCWIWILEVYTTQNLTKASNRLPALSGLARQGKGNYYADLWGGDMVELAWEVCNHVHRSRPLEYLGPSWSWVSAIRATTWCGYIRKSWRGNTRVLVDIKEVEEKTNIDPTVAVSGRFMIIKGRCLHAQLANDGRITTVLGDFLDTFTPDAPVEDVEDLKIKLLP